MPTVSTRPPYKHGAILSTCAEPLATTDGESAATVAPIASVPPPSTVRAAVVAPEDAAAGPRDGSAPVPSGPDSAAETPAELAAWAERCFDVGRIRCDRVSQLCAVEHRQVRTFTRRSHQVSGISDQERASA